MQVLAWASFFRHNPYFNRWFSAIRNYCLRTGKNQQSHNPYFNRWFSAMYLQGIEEVEVSKSQSLF